MAFQVLVWYDPTGNCVTFANRKTTGTRWSNLLVIKANYKLATKRHHTYKKGETTGPNRKAVTSPISQGTGRQSAVFLVNGQYCCK